MLGFIDYSLKPKEIQLHVAKPNGVKIGKLNKYVTNLQYSPKLGRMFEISFTVPYSIQDIFTHEFIDNPILKKIKDRYLLIASLDGKEERYIINNIKDSMDESKDLKEVHAYSLEYELKDKTIREYKVESYTLLHVATDALAKTIWNVGEIDSKFFPKYRAFDISEMSVLDFLYQASETYGALIEFDRINRLVHFRDLEKIGSYRGLNISYGKYLKSVGKTSDPDEMVTRLHIFGKDGVSVNRVNPSGSSYIEDFSFFMYPFERDENKNIIKKSDYMSDELCHAILDYNDLIKSKEGVYDGLLTQLEEKQVALTTKKNEMSVLNADYAIILDRIDVAKANNEDPTSIEDERDAKKLEIDAKQAEIDSVQGEVDSVNSQITNLQNEIAIENNFTPELIDERNQYIIERTWSDPNYIDPKEQLKDAQEKFIELKQPKSTFEFDMINFLQVVEEQKNWDKLVIGDEIGIKYERIGVKIRAKITEINFDYANQTISLSIANVKDLYGDAANLLKLLKQSASTSKTLDMNKWKYDETIDRTDSIRDIIEGAWDSAKRKILAGVKNSIDISGRGIIVRNPDFENEVVIIQSGVIAMSEDFGDTWKTAITGKRIVAENILGKLIMGENLIIGDDEGTFEIKGNMLTIKDRQDIVRLLLGEYEKDKFGLKLMNKTGQDVILDENGILQSWQEGRADNVDASNGLSMNVYFPEDTLSIRRVLLNFKLLPFRSYSKATASAGSTQLTSSSGGGNSATSTSGGGTTATSSSGGGVSTSTNSGGGTTESSSAGGNHSHLVFAAVEGPAPVTQERPYAGKTSGGANETFYLAASGADIYTYGSSGNHSHSVSVPSHSHDFSVPNHSHSVSIPNHSHTVNIPDHTHSVNIPAHTHDQVHGIYTGTTATNVSVWVNGINRTIELGGKFNADQTNLSIGQYLRIGQWNEIKLTSESLGRLDANVFIQAFLGT